MSTPLKGVVAIVDVCIDDSVSVSESIADVLISLGAKVLKQWSAKVTHFVLKDGVKKKTIERARQNSRIRIVSPSWVEACRQKKCRVEEADYYVMDTTDTNSCRQRDMKPVTIDSISGREKLFSTRREEKQSSSAQRSRIPRLGRKRRSSLLELCSDYGEDTEGSDFVPGSPALEEPNDVHAFEPEPPLHFDEVQACDSGAQIIRSDDDRNIDSPRSFFGDDEPMYTSRSREGMPETKRPASDKKRTKSQQKKRRISKSLQAESAKKSNLSKKAMKSPKDEKVVKKRLNSVQKKKKSSSSSKHRNANTKRITLTGVDDSVRDTAVQLENVLEGFEVCEPKDLDFDVLATMLPPPRTMKILFALALGKPIIDVKFVFDSLESLEWKNVLDYEISSLPSKLSRTQHLQEGYKGLLSNDVVWVADKVKPSREKIQELLLSAGADITDDKREATVSIGLKEGEETLSTAWLFDSLEKYERICTGATVSDDEAESATY